MVTEADVLQALRAVQEPEQGGDLVSRNLIRNIKICDGNVAFEVLLPNPATPAKPQVQRECREAVQRVPGVKVVNVRLPGNVTPHAGAGPSPASSLVPGVRSVVAIASGKGGVGKSTVAANVAGALAEGGARVGLLDADIYGPSQTIMMGAHERPPVQGGRIVPLRRHDVALMSLGLLMDDTAAPVVWRGPMVGSAVRQMLADVDWGELDYLFVDLPPGTGDAPLTLAQIVPLTGAVIVMTSQDVAVDIASKALAMFRRLRVPILGIVENMSVFACPHCGQETPIFTQGGSASAADRLGVPFLGSIPLDPAVVRHGDEGTPTVLAASESAQAEAFREVARALADRICAAKSSQENDLAMGASQDPLGRLIGRLGHG